MKKFNFVYKTTNLINKKIYIGVHSTNDLDDGYLGSGLNIRRAIEKYGKENFKREILYKFKTQKEAYKKEAELVNEEFIKREDNYNITTGGHGISEDIVCVKDKDGNKFRVSVDDPRYLSGELVHHTKGTITVKDKDGNCFRVSKDDPRWLSGELVSIIKGRKLSEERSIHRKKLYKDGILKNPKNKTTVKDKDGNTFRVDIDDPRYLSGELVGINKGRIYICNIKLKQNKRIFKEELQSYLNKGWKKGRIIKNSKKIK